MSWGWLSIGALPAGTLGTAVKHKALQTRVTKLSGNLISSFLPCSLAFCLPVRVCVALLFCFLANEATKPAEHHRAIQCIKCFE